ncbi:MAG: hypothetical protein ACREJC_11510 [Tepidisphaeraceae bacterium]
MQTTTLRPGLLVSLGTRLQGNVTYAKRTIESAHLDSAGAEREIWETERTVADPVELEAAKKARSKASSLIRGVCAQSAFGLLCPENRASDLEQAITQARTVAEDFNAGARLSRVSVYVITGRIAPDDVEAVRAINSEVRELMDDMARGLSNLDPATIREAANKARALGSMLSPAAESRVKEAIEAARSAARKIVKAGETAAVEVDTLAIRRIATQRTAFLDLDEAAEIEAPAAQGRALDFEAPVEIKASPVQQPAFEL